RRSSRSTAVRASRASAAARRSRRSAPRAAARGTARRVSGSEQTLRREPLELAAAIELPELGVAADRPAVDQDLRHGPAAGELEEALPERGIVVERDLLVVEPARVQQRLRADAIAAPAGGVHLDLGHLRVQTRKRRADSRPGADLHLPGWDAPTRRRRSCCARFAWAKPTGSFTS